MFGLSCEFHRRWRRPWQVIVVVRMIWHLRLSAILKEMRRFEGVIDRGEIGR